jgi:hypothetical protein
LLTTLAGKGKVVEFIHPSHKQRLLYRLPDMGDGTTPNHAKP